MAKNIITFTNFFYIYEQFDNIFKSACIFAIPDLLFMKGRYRFFINKLKTGVYFSHSQPLVYEGTIFQFPIAVCTAFIKTVKISIFFGSGVYFSHSQPLVYEGTIYPFVDSGLNRYK